MAQRKCPKCQHWNEGKDYCEKCQTALSADALAKERDLLRIESEKNKPKDKIQLWIEKVKNHKNWFVRATYSVLYSIWAVYMAFVAFFVWLTIGTNG